MRNIKNTLKRITICLVAFVCISANITMVAKATEVESSSAPIIEVQNYTIEGGMIEAGKEITVNLTLHNTAADMSANSIMMTLSNSTGMIYPVYGNDNQVFVGTISAGKTKTVSVPLTIGDKFIGSAIDLVCQFDYETNGIGLNNVSTIVIPTSGGSTIGVKSVDVSSHAIVNGKSLLEFSYINQSSSNITDAKLIVEGNVSSASKEIKLDTVYSGKSYIQDYYVTFTEPGNQKIKVSLEYTDIDGDTTVTDLGTYDVTVSKESAVETKDNQIGTILKWAGRGIALVVLIVTLVACISYIKKR